MIPEAQHELSHIDTAIPEPPDASFFTEAQWRVWYALMDTIIPPIVPKAIENQSANDYPLESCTIDSYYQYVQSKFSSPPSREDFEAYLSEKPSNTQAFRDHMTRTLDSLPKDMRDQLASILSLLGYRLGSLGLTGHLKPFYELSAEERERVVLSWQSSRIATLRELAKPIGLLGKKVWIQTSPMFRKLSGWTDLPEDYKAAPAAKYSFRKFSRGDEPEVLNTDVVVVGSGCGGGVCAKVLAEAGHRVTVVDKGYYFPPEQLPMRSEAAEVNLFENGGLVSVDEGCMSVLAGSTWGGGGVVNWGVSMEPPQEVREEWATKRGLPFFTSKGFQDSLDRVSQFMGVSNTTVRQNHRGQVLLDGAKKIGWQAKVTPHNSGNKDHHCGHCHLGCGSAGKKGPAVSWLPAAAGAGAEFIEGFQVERILFDTFATGKRASGVTGRWVSRGPNGKVHEHPDQRITRTISIKAKRVVISCGTLWSPVILRNSGLANPQIGRNLYAHPVNSLGAFWEESVNPWDGCAITSVCTTFENLDNEGHGAKLEPMGMVPYLVYPLLPWRGGIDFKMCSLRYRHMDVFISIPRDKDTGRVYPDPKTGRPRISYSPSAFDRASALEGIVALARICYVMEAEEIRPFYSGIDPFLREKSEMGSEAERARFEEWLNKLRAAGNPTTEPWGCAHQMGTCRMSKSEDEGVVDPKGKVWGIEGLYVADASVFPSATGVNPMLTNMAISDSIARGIVADLNAIKGRYL